MVMRVKPREKIVQKSVGFHFRQIEFFNANPNFKPDKYCRKIIDDQIRLSGEENFIYLEDEECS